MVRVMGKISSGSKILNLLEVLNSWEWVRNGFSPYSWEMLEKMRDFDKNPIQPGK
jgi:hypothetical protein